MMLTMNRHTLVCALLVLVGCAAPQAAPPNVTVPANPLPHVDETAVVARKNARELEAIVSQTRAELEKRAHAINAAVVTLRGHSFPRSLAADLHRIDLDGSALAGRSLNGFSGETAKLLFDFIVRVIVLGDRIDATRTLVVKLEKPVTEMLDAQARGLHSIRHVVLLGGATGKDAAGNHVGSLAELRPPLTFSSDAPLVPNNIEAVLMGQRVSVAMYKSGSLDKPSAVYVAPVTFDAVCPDESKSLVAQLMVRLNDVVVTIQGDDPEGAEPLVAMAKRLSGALEKM